MPDRPKGIRLQRDEATAVMDLSSRIQTIVEKLIAELEAARETIAQVPGGGGTDA